MADHHIKLTSSLILQIDGSSSLHSTTLTLLTCRYHC